MRINAKNLHIKRNSLKIISTFKELFIVHMFCKNVQIQLLSIYTFYSMMKCEPRADCSSFSRLFALIGLDM